MAKSGYLPTLDGWRAIAILSVIFYHDSQHKWSSWLYVNGHYGVELFFAISGVLICWRLMEEEQMRGSISLRGFYVRRAFRILPPALAFLAVVGILALAGLIGVGWREWVSALFFTRNYSFLSGHGKFDPYFTEHYWSLSLEEHFYFMLPSLIFFLPKWARVPSLAAICMAVIAHRYIVLTHRPWSHVLFHTDVRLDALLIPAIFAILAQYSSVRDWMRDWFQGWPVVLVLLVVMVPLHISAFWMATAMACLLPIVVMGSMLHPDTAWSRWLEWAPLRYVGRISFSLYLWQQLFFVGHFYERFPLGILQSTWLRFVALAAAATASYHFLEQPMMRMGRRFAPPATAGRI